MIATFFGVVDVDLLAVASSVDSTAERSDDGVVCSRRVWWRAIVLLCDGIKAAAETRKGVSRANVIERLRQLYGFIILLTCRCG